MEESSKALAAEAELKKFGVLVDKIGDVLIDDKYEAGNFTDFPFLKVECKPREFASLASLTRSENTMMSKVVMALAAIVQELDYCTDEAKSLYDVFLYYGEPLPDDDVEESEAMKNIARLLPTIQKASCLVDHCSEVVLNTIHQLSSLKDPQATSGSAKFAASPDVNLHAVYSSLAKLLSALIVIDGIILQHSNLRGHWATYRRYIKAAIMDPSQFNVDTLEMRKLEKLLGPAESKIIDGNLFKSCIDQEYNKNGFFVTKNSVFCDSFNQCIRLMISEIESNSTNMKPDPEERLNLVGVFALMTLHNKMFPNMDRKLVNKILELCKKVPGVTLHGQVMWFPEQFLISHLSAVAKMMDKKLVQTLSSNRHNYLQAKAQSCQNDLKQYHHQLNGWVVKMESVFRSQPGANLTLEHIERATNLLLVGLGLASELRTTTTTILNLHGKLSVPLTKTSVIAVCKAMEVLKAIESTFHRHSLAISSLSGHVYQKLASSIILTIEKAKATASRGTERKYSKLDILAALVLAETAFLGPYTSTRKAVSEVAVAFAAQNKTFPQDDYVMLMVLIKKLACLSRLEELITNACDTSFLYWHKLILPVYFEQLFKGKTEAYRLNYTFRAIQDCITPLKKVKHLESVILLENSFNSEIEKYLMDKVINPLCEYLETDLRLQVHSHLQLDDRNPFHGKVNDASGFLALPPLLLGEMYINIKAKVEAYLEKTFYNLTTVALHNWRTYGEMRAMATHNYKAQTVDDHLPAQTLEQGLDVLEIMRNIHVFVSHYLYNLNHQIFVEARSQNKHLNTITIRHIANSIRTHGTGIMNTTVNFSYQFLKKKFGIFSQFLFDDQIKSRLAKDARTFKEQQNGLHQKYYPYDRAEKFNKGIRKLGVLDGNTTYLDQFRMLISQIGNTMGYVRMIKAGGLHFLSNSIRFVPDLDDIPKFENLSVDEGLDSIPETIEAAKTLDLVVENLSQNFTDSTEYFELLVNVFGKQLHDEKHPHLKNFYLIIPPLTINYVDHMIAAKEKLNKNNFDGAAFTDDGLVMGIAYILRLLNQWQAFDSLHWFQSVREKYVKEKTQVARQNSEAAGNDQKLQQTLELTQKRLETYQKEFELLFYNLSSARIFFRMDENDDDEDEDDLKSVLG